MNHRCKKFVNYMATNREVAKEVIEQLVVLDDMCIKYTTYDITQMCKASNIYGVQRYAHDLKFA